MADNVSVAAGAYTAIVASDDIAGVQYQRVKLALGADGVATDIGLGQGTMAASIPVTLASNQTLAASSFDHGSNRDVDTTAEALTASSIPARYGVWVKADPGNTGILYLGNADVTAGTTDATDGYPLFAGNEVFIQVDNANKVFAIGSAVNQIVYWRTE